MKKLEPSTFNTKTLLEYILASQVLLLARQLRVDDTAWNAASLTDNRLR